MNKGRSKKQKNEGRKVRREREAGKREMRHIVGNRISG
jgi:hypothetical protein